MILHYSDGGEALIAPICIPREKKNLKSLFKEFYKPHTQTKNFFQQDCFIM